MLPPVTIRIVNDNGGWRVAMGDGDARVVEDRLSAELVSEVCARAHTFPAAGPVPIPGRDVQWVRAEEEAGAALSRLWQASPRLTGRLSWFLGRAHHGTERMVLVVDAEPEEARALPWELACRDSSCPPLETLGEAVVVRLSGSMARPPVERAATLRTYVWCPTPADPACTAVLAALDVTLAGLALPRAALVDPTVTPVPPPDPDVACILHVVCHGRVDADRVELLLAEGIGTADATAHLLCEWLRAMAVVVLDMCDAGRPAVREIDGLAPRVVAAGARVCIAPVRRTNRRAIISFSSGFYPALSAGRPVGEAVARGRAAVAKLGIGHPDSRWWNHALFTASTLAPTTPLLRPRWKPEGWPVPSPEAAAYLMRVRSVAERSGAGFVGLEHFAIAICEGPLDGIYALNARFALLGRLPLAEAVSAGLRPTDAGPDWGGTPRVRRLAPTDGFTVDDLWVRITTDPHHALHDLARAPLLRKSAGSATEEEPEWPSPTTLPDPAVALQVLGGPEDGRVLEMRPGDWIGRWSDDPALAHALYRATPLVDPSLSRRHACWLGTGRVRLAASGRRVRGGQTLRIEPGELDLLKGDVLELGAGTRLRGV